METCDRVSRAKRRQIMAMRSALREGKLLLGATANDARTFYFPECLGVARRSSELEGAPQAAKTQTTVCLPSTTVPYYRPALTVDRCCVVAAIIAARTLKKRPFASQPSPLHPPLLRLTQHSQHSKPQHLQPSRSRHCSTKGTHITRAREEEGTESSVLEVIASSNTNIYTVCNAFSATVPHPQPSPPLPQAHT